jgi:hypothetical protein
MNHLAGFSCLSFGTQSKQETNYCKLQHLSLSSMPHSIQSVPSVGVVQRTTGNSEVDQR